MVAFAQRIRAFYNRHPQAAPLIVGMQLFGLSDLAANRIENSFSPADAPVSLNPCRTIGAMAAALPTNGALVWFYRGVGTPQCTRMKVYSVVLSVEGRGVLLSWHLTKSSILLCGPLSNDPAAGHE